jgi:hypothetical protein
MMIPLPAGRVVAHSRRCLLSWLQLRRRGGVAANLPRGPFAAFQQPARPTSDKFVLVARKLPKQAVQRRVIVSGSRRRIGPAAAGAGGFSRHG